MEGEAMNQEENVKHTKEVGDKAKKYSKVIKRLILGVIGTGVIAGVSIGAFVLLSGNTSISDDVSTKSFDIADSFDFDCEAQEIIGEGDGNGVFCSEQKITGTLPSDDEVVLKDADKYEIDGNNFTRTISYEFPQETYNAETLDIEAVKAGQDDEIEITLLDGDTGEVLATKTVQVHYSISDEDVDKIIHYSITISNITVEQIQQVIVQNNPGYTTEDIEKIIQEREDRIAAEKEAKRQKELEEARKKAEEESLQQQRIGAVKNMEQKVFAYEVCSKEDDSSLDVSIDNKPYRLRIGCAQRNRQFIMGEALVDEGHDKIDMRIEVVSGYESTITPPDFSMCDGDMNNLSWSDYDTCQNREETEKEAWRVYQRDLVEERLEFEKKLCTNIKIIHNKGMSECSAMYKNQQNQQYGYTNLDFTVPRGADKFTIDVNGVRASTPILFTWPLTYDQISKYL